MKKINPKSRRTLNPKLKGFTLIELSVVLVILSILVGGVLAGQTMIKTAELNSFVTDIERFESAFARFQAEYQQLPGDFDKAYNYWGNKCGTNSTLCNGDGNGLSDSNNDEGLRFWNHLYQSKMVENYSEPISDETADCELGVNSPYTSMDSVSMMPSSDELEAKSVSSPNLGQLFIFSLNSEDTDASDCVRGNDAFTAEQLYTIDKKIDDGFAYDGKVLNSQNDTGCTTSANTGTGDLDDGDYDLANNGVNLCKLFVKVRVD